MATTPRVPQYPSVCLSVPHSFSPCEPACLTAKHPLVFTCTSSLRALLLLTASYVSLSCASRAESRFFHTRLPRDNLLRRTCATSQQQRKLSSSNNAAVAQAAAAYHLQRACMGAGVVLSSGWSEELVGTAPACSKALAATAYSVWAKHASNTVR